MSVKQVMLLLFNTIMDWFRWLSISTLHGSAPAYLTDELCQVADVSDFVPVHLRH